MCLEEEEGEPLINLDAPITTGQIEFLEGMLHRLAPSCVMDLPSHLSSATVYTVLCLTCRFLACSSCHWHSLVCLHPPPSFPAHEGERFAALPNLNQFPVSPCGFSEEFILSLMSVK